MTAHALVLLHLRRNLNIANPLDWALGYMRCASAWYLFEMGKCVVGEHCDAVIHPVISARLVQNQGNLSTSWRRRDGKLGRKIRLLFTVSKVYRSTNWNAWPTLEQSRLGWKDTNVSCNCLSISISTKTQRVFLNQIRCGKFAVKNVVRRVKNSRRLIIDTLIRKWINVPIWIAKTTSRFEQIVQATSASQCWAGVVRTYASQWTFFPQTATLSFRLAFFSAVDKSGCCDIMLAWYKTAE